MSVDPRDFFFRHALLNAVQHENVPKAGTVLGMLMGKHPEFRSQAKEMSAILKDVLSEVEALSPEERKERLMAVAPELLTEKKEKKEKEPLRELKNVGEEGVVMRFAPNPSGPLHLGHARAAYLNDYYVRKYGGKYVLRIEDTDPRRVEPENYELLLEDIKWLGLNITDIVYQSDRFDIYYEHGRRLIEIGGAYVCTCDAESFRELKNSKKPCPCRDNSVEDNLRQWDEMLAGGFAEGTVTVRVKTDIEHPDPAMRDFSIFRVVDSPPHPRKDVTVYPMMNLSVVVDDYLLGMTHVIRGKDHIANTRRQGYIYDYFGWKQPEYYHYGRMSVGDVVLSTSAMKAGISDGTYSGWDDIRLGTLKAIARRGIKPEAVRKAMVDLGVGQTDINFSWENLFAENKAIIDPVSDRYFFVPQPALFEISGAPSKTAEIPLHPNESSRGVRKLEFTGKVHISPEDIAGKSFVRLKDLFNVTVTEKDGEALITYAGDSLEEAKEKHAPIIQWLPYGKASVPCRIKRPDGDAEGLCEEGVKHMAGEEIQFERIGFVKIDSVSGDSVTAYFTHR
ncbi:glutamate--tRNA ligase [Methanoplanus limicola]|uniref:Glutamate--tRNA ligase n=1 Tax=Methanoplanus limicola DSM 2279 TaxID=937775 RepID=H1YW87_9EURY|nr:glutamate--tRNA ligase [Methanoplanus limicola]EHQ34809.1 glutamyl-tRNA synthetase [Methanoplanus limicola DSM 2279]